ncbi:hydantoinase/oxoprolinase N-terminal domain-containing protein [Paracraurococcus ruber]|uniref:Hydantoinase n=1 Tax=Paracraurococcus ruber TaxID=77675 RepID=A0ABS1CS99_9PROT|nr:hydantoinase/oxoprolinase family protein [Paracraurococcus ruber]MBK1657341.1 hydantoinase [Paracraurococcus ruber]TDG34010.1 hydantoinase/oxoprolinase family protein [Paracraurococcus ruber]
MRRIGIDVGGTNTDAVLLDGARVAFATKTPTTADVLTGVRTALGAVSASGAGEVQAVMIGTTHFVNAVVQRRHLARVGALRLGLPAAASLPPFCDWPEDLAGIVRGQVHMAEGGHDYDGRPIMALDERAVAQAARAMRAAGIGCVAVSSIFSPLDPSMEDRAADIVRQEIPEVSITLSHDLGRIGLLERENVALLNACLTPLARHTVRAFEQALAAAGIAAPLFVTQNDGTVIRAELAARFPVLSFASGPTNSMRGAAFLTGVKDALVVDVGGTTSDVGALRHGFPREANAVVQVGGVRTLFRMPDLLSFGLGGGSLVTEWPLAIGPVSVGYRLPDRARIFGGPDLTASDIAVAAGRLALGDAARVADLPSTLVQDALALAARMLEEAVDRMKTDAAEVPLLAVGGGAFLVPDRLPGISALLRPDHAAVANAVGAAIAQVSGEVDQVFQGLSRTEALDEAGRIARARAVEAGADPRTLMLVDQEDLPIAYLPGGALRVRARVIGDIASGTVAG